MKQHIFNLYPVTNQDDLRISYRFVEVDGELGLGSVLEEEAEDFGEKNSWRREIEVK